VALAVLIGGENDMRKLQWMFRLFDHDGKGEDGVLTARQLYDWSCTLSSFEVYTDLSTRPLPPAMHGDDTQNSHRAISATLRDVAAYQDVLGEKMDLMAAKLRKDVLMIPAKAKPPTNEFGEWTELMQEGHQHYMSGKANLAIEKYTAAGDEGLPCLVSLLLIQGKVAPARDAIAKRVRARREVGNSRRHLRHRHELEPPTVEWGRVKLESRADSRAVDAAAKVLCDAFAEMAVRGVPHSVGGSMRVPSPLRHQGFELQYNETKRKWENKYKLDTKKEPLDYGEVEIVCLKPPKTMEKNPNGTKTPFPLRVIELQIAGKLYPDALELCRRLGYRTAEIRLDALLRLAKRKHTAGLPPPQSLLEAQLEEAQREPEIHGIIRVLRRAEHPWCVQDGSDRAGLLHSTLRYHLRVLKHSVIQASGREPGPPELPPCLRQDDAAPSAWPTPPPGCQLPHIAHLALRCLSFLSLLGEGGLLALGGLAEGDAAPRDESGIELISLVGSLVHCLWYLRLHGREVAKDEAWGRWVSQAKTEGGVLRADPRGYTDPFEWARDPKVGAFTARVKSCLQPLTAPILEVAVAESPA